MGVPYIYPATKKKGGETHKTGKKVTATALVCLKERDDSGLESSHSQLLLLGRTLLGFAMASLTTFENLLPAAHRYLGWVWSSVERETSSSQAQYISQKGAFLLLLFYFIIIIISEAESLNGPHFKVTPRLPPPSSFLRDFSKRGLG
jgi:hypothetical protein